MMIFLRTSSGNILCIRDSVSQRQRPTDDGTGRYCHFRASPFFVVDEDEGGGNVYKRGEDAEKKLRKRRHGRGLEHDGEKNVYPESALTLFCRLSPVPSV